MPRTRPYNPVRGAADPAWFDLSRTDRFAQSTIFGDEAYEGVGDFFGWSFAAGDFDGDGAPGAVNAGGEAVLYGAPLGSLFSDGFELGKSRWSAATP